MTRCLVARTVTITLTGDGGDPQYYELTIPAGWTQEVFQAEIGAQHPEETLEIVTWGIVELNGSGFPVGWLVNPTGFVDYEKGER